MRPCVAQVEVSDIDHSLPFLGPVDRDMLEAYTTLGFVAGLTSRIKLGVMVGGVTYRHPGILVKTATTLDVLSKGRSYFGIGAGWFEDEHVGLGVPFPSMSERFERLDETLQIAHQMWRADESPFRGKHYSLDRPLCVPQPVSRPHPPVMIGGSGEKKTLRLVARHGDACNLSRALLEPDPVAAVRQKLSVLEAHCETENRPYEAIEKTAIGMWTFSRNGGPTIMHHNEDLARHQRSLGIEVSSEGIPMRNLSVSEAIEHIEELAEAGLDQIIIGQGTEDVDFDLLASEIIPRISPMGRATAASRT